jgi:hypothetical protein
MQDFYSKLIASNLSTFAVLDNMGANAEDGSRNDKKAEEDANVDKILEDVSSNDNNADNCNENKSGSENVAAEDSGNLDDENEGIGDGGGKDSGAHGTQQEKQPKNGTNGQNNVKKTNPIIVTSSNDAKNVTISGYKPNHRIAVGCLKNVLVYLLLGDYSEFIKYSNIYTSTVGMHKVPIRNGRSFVRKRINNRKFPVNGKIAI